MKYRFIEDPGHGWLEVPLEEIKSLGIWDDISSYSYVSGSGVAYLEEDCDLSAFLRAKGYVSPRSSEAAKAKMAAFWDNDVTTIYEENTFVRNLPSFSALH